jgi:hypothetical protein
MTTGRLRCLGSGAGLRRLYSGGYALAVRRDARAASLAQCVRAVQRAVPGILFVEEPEDGTAAGGGREEPTLLTFTLPPPGAPVALASFREDEGGERTVAVQGGTLAQAFSAMSRLQREGAGGIAEWSLGQRSLCDVFERVVRHYQTRTD